MELVSAPKLNGKVQTLSKFRANLTNMVWVEQPVGTGFTQGTPTATSQEESAAQFLGFWKNFMETFGLTGKKVYIAGESYAGRQVPWSKLRKALLLTLRQLCALHR